MEKQDLVVLALLVRLFGYRYTDFLYVVPWALLNISRRLDLNPYPFGKKYVIINLPYELIDKFSIHDEMMDLIWLRASANVIKNEEISSYLNVCKRTNHNWLRITKYNLTELSLMSDIIADILNKADTLYYEQLAVAFPPEELNLFQWLAGRTLTKFRLSESV